MRRALVILLALSIAPALAHGQDPSPARPAFHAGQWAAEFTLSGGFSGIGAIHFSTPAKAWTLAAQVGGQFTDWSGNNNSGDYQNVTLNVGRRWYRQGAARVRPFTGLGLSGSFSRRHSQAGTNDQSSRSYGGGLFGQLGAAVFFAPELSLGATWSANLTVLHQGNYINGAFQNDLTNIGFNAGFLSLQGAFYF